MSDDTGEDLDPWIEVYELKAATESASGVTIEVYAADRDDIELFVAGEQYLPEEGEG